MMGLPTRLYYSLDKAAKEINGDISDILYYISVGLLDVSLKVNLSDFIATGKVSISGRFNKPALIKPSTARLKHRTNYARITEILKIKNGLHISRQALKVEGVFSIRLPTLMTFGSKIFESDNFNVTRLYPVRMPIFSHLDFYGYDPRVIIIHGGLNISFKDLVITKDELDLLKLGGISINWRLNHQSITVDKVPVEFRARLNDFYALRKQSGNISVGKPRNKHRDVIVDVAKATRVKCPWSSTASMIRKIHLLLESNDPKNTPKEGTIRNILCSVGIGKTGNETKQDFELEIPNKYLDEFKLNN